MSKRKKNSKFFNFIILKGRKKNWNYPLIFDGHKDQGSNPKDLQFEYELLLLKKLQRKIEITAGKKALLINEMIKRT